MKKFSAIIALCCSLLLAACGSGSPAADSSHIHVDNKPALDVKWEVKGSTLAIDVTTDMHISPEHYGQARKNGEGHIHLYLDDGEKIAVTESHQEFPNLSAGPHTIKVSLHNNDHTPYDVTKTIKFDIP